MSAGQAAGHRVVRVAILASEPMGWGSGRHFFLALLDGFMWEAGGHSYRIQAEYVDDAAVLRGRLTTLDFDVLVVPGGGVGDGHAVMKGFRLLPSVRLWKKRIASYVKQGGGYVGICGGTALMTRLCTERGKPRTFMERQYDKSALGVSCVSSYYRTLAFPLVYPFQSRHPEDVGAASYVFSFAPGVTVDGKLVHTGGAPVEFRVDTSHPVFRGAQAREVIRWWGGPGLLVPKDPGRKVSVLAWYPEVDISSNPLTRIASWRYAGGLRGLVRSVLGAFRQVKVERGPLRKVVLYAFYLAGPWERTERPVRLDQAGLPAVTAEVFPNEHAGRILLCTAHPEYMPWREGRIVEREPSPDVCIGTGFRRWEGIETFSELEAEVAATWWMVRRFVAWAGKVPDDALPPKEAVTLPAKVCRELFPYIVWDGSRENQFMTI